MAFLIEETSPLFVTKLTSIGRKKLASGTLDYKYLALGDSELDYRYDDLIPSVLGLQNVMKPFDFQPYLRSFLETDLCERFITVDNNILRVQQCCGSNPSLERGFFSGDTETNMEIKFADFIKFFGTLNLTDMNGTNLLDLGTTQFDDGDFLLIKITNTTAGLLPNTETQTPVLYLWFKIEKQPASTQVILDRNLPDFSLFANIDISFYIYPGGNSITGYYGTTSPLPYWNPDTLDFQSDCDISSGETPVWNFNAVWNESMAGTQLDYETYEQYGSFDFIGDKEYFGYNKPCLIPRTVEDCQDKLLAVKDPFCKGIGIIHYSNMNLSNEYGEFLYVSERDGCAVDVLFPTLMWHNRFFTGSTANLLGMTFSSDYELKYLDNTDVSYYDLVENSDLIMSGSTPMVVGKVFHNHKIIIIEHPELLAAISYKSNRNFSLPALEGKMLYPISGIGTGVLAKNKTMYLTYVFESDFGNRFVLPQQQYIKYVNNTNIDRDIDFIIEDVGLLKYMRQLENLAYDGLGFFAHRFKILAQIVDNPNDRPQPQLWKEIDFTSLAITNAAGYTINPQQLERQNPASNNFILTKALYDAAPLYDLGNLGIPQVCCPEVLNFGDERFFYGNIRTCIGFCIYRTIFTLRVDSNKILRTTNSTWKAGQPIKFHEIGIFSSDRQLVAIAKISRPLTLRENHTFGLEFSIDF